MVHLGDPKKKQAWKELQDLCYVRVETPRILYVIPKAKTPNYLEIKRLKQTLRTEFDDIRDE